MSQDQGFGKEAPSPFTWTGCTERMQTIKVLMDIREISLKPTFQLRWTSAAPLSSTKISLMLLNPFWGRDYDSTCSDKRELPVKALEKQIVCCPAVWTGAAALASDMQQGATQFGLEITEERKKNVLTCLLLQIAGVKQVLPTTGCKHGHRAPALWVVYFPYARGSQQAQWAQADLSVAELCSGFFLHAAHNRRQPFHQCFPFASLLA